MSSKEQREETKRRMDKIHTEAKAIVAVGKCPDCGRALKRNLSMSGWWQCEQYGSKQFRAEPAKPSCDFQCFTA